ncbi:glycerol acyltransferase [Endozoicomonas sp. (ex Bugula neritina AB1)]|nr:glycerol acyltransferase [Endozoicomonas sp. (ex Bugula neritina AB1)]
MSLFLSLIKTFIFYISLVTWTGFWTTLMILCIHFFPFRKRHTLFVKTWAIVAVHLCRYICGVRWEISGQEHIPEQPCVVISNHQSTWETFFFQTLLSPQTQVLKQELLKIPFFGWALARTKPIAIDRSDVRKSLHQVQDQGKESLRQGVWVLIFPEGTRNTPGKLGKFTRGGAGLAHATKSQILPIAHNAGVYWPMNSWIKTPGTIKVSIGPTINTPQLSVAEANNQAREWIGSALKEMS